jgi:hypothetical protein
LKERQEIPYKLLRWADHRLVILCPLSVSYSVNNREIDEIRIAFYAWRRDARACVGLR